MKSFFFAFSLMLVSNISHAQGKVVYKYKQYEEINLGEISVDGELGAPGEITVSERYLRSFKNKLPTKPNFHFEMMNGLDKIR